MRNTHAAKDQIIANLEQSLFELRGKNELLRFEATDLTKRLNDVHGDRQELLRMLLAAEKQIQFLTSRLFAAHTERAKAQRNAGSKLNTLRQLQDKYPGAYMRQGKFYSKSGQELAV